MTGQNKGSSNAGKAKASKQSRSKRQPSKVQTSSPAKDTNDQNQLASHVDRKHQQRVLDVFRHTFHEVLSSSSFTAKLQNVKQALFDRDFAKAFGDPDSLAVYAARWSPTRALCYAGVFNGIREQLDLISTHFQADDGKQGDRDSEKSVNCPQLERRIKLLSIGGGAAEVVAFGAFLNQYPSLSGSITLLDSGPWATVVSQLTTSLTTPPPLSNFASEAAKASNSPMVPASRFTPTFVQQDALALGSERLSTLVGSQPLLVTVLFTLNELFTASGIGKTTAFLLDLTSTIPIGSLLLVVDSPGSYSETSVGKEEKRYPMQWLLDRIMLGTQREPVNGRRWAKLESQDSVWFRLAGTEALDYPIPLENMRYQLHLYKAEDASLDGED